MVDEADTRDLLTVRDFWRYATSTFEAARLTYGHGTSTALDEAAFLILVALHLPIDQLEPWLDARLTPRERTAIATLIAARVATRKPAAYLVNAAFMQGHRFYVDERVIVPRSFIGELIADGTIAALLPDPDNQENIADMCTGSGCLAILAALRFRDAHVDAIDVSGDALDVARRNISDYGLADRITPLRSDLFGSVPPKRYDLIIANPPYVSAAEVAAFDPEYRAEPVLAHAAGPDGLDFAVRILEAAAQYLADDGILIMEIGLGRAALEARFPETVFTWLDTVESHAEVLAITRLELQSLASP